MKRELSALEIKDVVAKLNSYLSDLKARWDQESTKIYSWWSLRRSHLLQATNFLIGILDELIQFVETVIPAGEDKKIAVLAMIGKMFDYIVVQAFPIWLKPFAAKIKDIIVGILISHLIDFIVDKYNSGLWKIEGGQDGQTTQT